MKVELKDKQSNGDFPHDGAYEVLRMHVRMKDPTTGKWVNAVAYGRGFSVFVREEKDFFDKFKEVKEE